MALTSAMLSPLKIIIYSKKYYLSDTKLGRTGIELKTLFSILRERCSWIYQWFLVKKKPQWENILNSNLGLFQYTSDTKVLSVT